MADVVDDIAAALLANAGPEDRDALEDVLAVIVLAVPIAERPTDDDVIALLGRFALRVGLRGDEPAGGAEAAIERYLEAHPLKTSLVEPAARAAREHLGAGGGLKDTLARFTGEREQKGVLGGTGARPKDATAAGPLARFLVHKKDPK